MKRPATFADDPGRTYARYIAACNERHFGDLDEFIANGVDGVRSGVDGTQHIRVEWVGLEGEPVSFAAGFVRARPALGRPGRLGTGPGRDQ